MSPPREAGLLYTEHSLFCNFMFYVRITHLTLSSERRAAVSSMPSTELNS